MTVSETGAVLATVSQLVGVADRKEQKEQDPGVLALKALEDREGYHKVTRGRSIVEPAPVVTELVVVERRIEPDPAASHERRDEQK